MSKRLTKKKLKQKDEFLTTAEKLLKVAAHNRSYLVIAGIILLFSAVFSSIGFYYYRSYSKKGSITYFQDLHLYEVAQNTQDKKDINNALDAFQSYRDSFKFLKTSKLALLYMGNCEYMLGDYDKAIATYTTFISDWAGRDRYITAIANNGIVQAYIAKNDCKSAMPIINSLLNDKNNSLLQLTYIHAVNCYLVSKESDKAIDLLNEGLKKYKDNKEIEQQLTSLMTYVKAKGQGNIINFQTGKF